MAYSGQAEQVFQDALVSAFPTYESMEQLVRLLDVNLAEISRRGNLRDVVFDVVRWADRENRVPDLVRTAAGEQPANPRLQQALRHVDDPLLVEDRWFARHVPVATWLLGAANLALLLLVIKVYFANLVNTFRLLSTLAVVCLVAVAAWRLYAWLFGKPVRARIGTLLRRLVAHSRLERRDWLVFAGLLAALRSFRPLLWLQRPRRWPCRSIGKRPTRSGRPTSFGSLVPFPTCPRRWRRRGPHARGLRDRDRFSETYYRADFFIGRRNLARRVKLQIDLLPPARRPGRVVRSARRHVCGRGRGPAPRRRAPRPGHQAARRSGRIGETNIELIVSLDEIVGERTVLFTCQRLLDGQPTPTEVAVYARILDAETGAILFPAEQVFPIDDWRRQEILARRGALDLHR